MNEHLTDYLRDELRTTKKIIRNNLMEYLEDTGQLEFATRADCVAYCIGYYGSVSTLCWKVITELAHEGHIRL